MKWLIFLVVLASAYTYGLLKTTDVVMSQVQNLNTTYQYVANNATNIANGKPIPTQILEHP